MTIEKPQYPPQGGEGRICLTIFCSMVISILSAVTIIYSSVIVYIPALKVLEANFTGDKMCTTILTQRNLQVSEKTENQAFICY